MRRKLAVLLALCMVAFSTAAQVRPQSSGGDPRLQSVEYRPEQIVTLEVATGYQLSLEFAPDEQIETVAIGDAGAWTVMPTKRGNHLFVKPLAEGVSTNMTVVTDTRTYLFDLAPLPGPSQMMAYTVRFTYPRGGMPGSGSFVPPPGAPIAKAVIETLYRVTGNRQLRPAAISDDGTKTYIRWPEDVPLPATYAIDERGRETLVNGMMREGIYEIDGVSRRLTFRIDERVARATRKIVRQPRR